MEKKLTCIICPKGCGINISYTKSEIIDITGNSCPKGLEYAKNEIIDPKRTITTTMKTTTGGLIPIKTTGEIKKALIMDCMNEINKHQAPSNTLIGDIVIKNILGEKADVVCTGREFL